MQIRLMITVVAAFLLSAGKTDAGWIGMVNKTGAPIRLLSFGLYSVTSTNFYNLFLGDLPSDEKAVWFKVPDDCPWRATLIRGFQAEGPRDFPFEGARPHRQDLPQINSPITLFTIEKGREVRIDSMKTFAGAEMTVVEPIWNLSLSTIVRNSKFVPRTTADEAKAILKELRDRYPEVVTTSSTGKDGLMVQCYVDGFRHGWFSAVFDSLDDCRLDLEGVLGDLGRKEGETPPNQRADLLVELNNGFSRGREAALEMLKRAKE